MDKLYTVFGLGTAFGIFCSWVYDVVIKRVQKAKEPVSRGRSFESFHSASAPIVSTAPMGTSDKMAFDTLPIAREEPSFQSGVPTPAWANTVQTPVEPAIPTSPTLVNTPVPVAAITPVVPRVILMINNVEDREIKESDLPNLMREFGIPANSEAGAVFQSGGPIQIGTNIICLTQA